MQKITCLIVEDEPLATEVLEDYISQVPFLQLVSTCHDAISALEVLQREKVTLIFLDIHLPKLKGLDFIKTLDNPPRIIITTAYQEYALQGYEMNVVDYLLKPIDFRRFINAVNKASQLIESSQPIADGQMAGERAYLFFNVGKKKVKMFLDEILYIESLKEYIKIVSSEKSILTKFQLGQTEDLLKNKNFLRIHRSFIVAKDKVDSFSATDIEIKGRLIPIGRSYKEQVYADLEK
ncbi:LytR/AlgR family response regulator transcription factor [Segetibacter aerophilus]|uniref:DNA-binding response regulator n=1 Tax=Segetibacter aerophilus TaxID=670293 RepID=A0A512BGH3_9BACT|nr:response regulator transcription factor [Segetibacter aerophilus]GEO11071.1 DNA-binding response regulator [Segetibacter aerophilus]